MPNAATRAARIQAPPTAPGATPNPIAVTALPVRKRRNEAARRDPRYIWLALLRSGGRWSET
jgi:hypothetical protein